MPVGLPRAKQVDGGLSQIFCALGRSHQQCSATIGYQAAIQNAYNNRTIKDLTTNKSIALAAALLVGTLAGVAVAQDKSAPAPAAAAAPAASSDPTVERRAAENAARQTYKEKIATAHKARDAKVKEAEAAAVKQAEQDGKDVPVARRDAHAKARKATKAEYDGAVKAAAKERDAAIATARKAAKG